MRMIRRKRRFWTEVGCWCVGRRPCLTKSNSPNFDSRVRDMTSDIIDITCAPKLDNPAALDTGKPLGIHFAPRPDDRGAIVVIFLTHPLSFLP